jgi:predicted transcriptional regulator
MAFVRITITHVTMPVISGPPTLNDELQWLGASLGFFNLRDKDKSLFRIFIALLKALKSGRGGFTSDELAYELQLTRATIIHHLNKLMEAGLVSSVRGKYVLNVSTLEELVDLTARNVNKTFEDLRRVAHDIDGKMELE